MSIVDSLSLLLAGTQAVLKKIDEIKPKEIQFVKIITEAYEMSKTLIKRVSTTAIRKADKPDVQFDNPLDAEIRIMSITLIPDASFKTKGLLSLLVNDVEILKVETAGDLTDYSTVNVPLPNEGAKLQRSKSVKLFAWTSDATASAITAQVHFQK